MRNFVFGIFVVLTVTATTGFGQSDSTLLLPDVMIKGNRIDMPFSETARSVEVMTREQIEAAPVISVAELLQYAAGIDVRQRGVHGVQADISIRGGTFDQVLILVNGIKLADPQTGHHALNLPVDIEQIERIEILKGPGARIFGQNAFAGAINIITRTPEEKFLRIGVQGGQYTLGGLKVSASLPIEKAQHYFSYSRDFSEGYRYNTDYNISNFFYQSDLQRGNTNYRILAGLTERAFGANGFYASPDFMDQYEEIQTSLVAVEAQTEKGNWTTTSRLSWRRNQDEYVFVRSNPSIYRNLHIGNTLGAEVHSAWRNSLGTTGLGLDLQQIRLQSNNLGYHNRTVVSAFVEHRFQWGRLDVIPGVLFNYFSDFDANFFPGLDVGFRLNSGLRLFANVGRTYRVPTFTDLYYEDPANLGNPELQPESAITYEGGIKWNYQGIQTQASYFRRDGQDLIDWSRAVDTLPWQPANFGNVMAQGAELSAQAYFPVLLQNEDAWLRRLTLSYTYIDAEILENDAAFSRYSLENLRHQFNATFEYRIAKRIHHTITYRYTDRVNLGPVSLIDTRIQYRADRWDCFLGATNLTDEEYRETNLVIMPGRWIRGGFSVTFR
ncbi:MAG: TonB-dependent receptor [Bacteroidota bacterium]